jgi:hypothetical protein
MVSGSCKYCWVGDNYSMLIFALQVAQGASDVGMAWIYKEKFQ